MRKFKQNNKAPARSQGNPALKKVRRTVYWQAGLAVMTVLLTVVIIFAMTSAWYTNVVHSSGLTFEAASWGFDGNIFVSDEAVQAAPGDEGAVTMSVENSSDNISDVSVNISKATMAAEMQKRIYFYVDTQQTRNRETMGRVYLSNQESYTYTLFSKGTLNLTQTYHNDAQLKWQWVYDVLGYYVLATEGTDGAMTVHEYLRPIEYDYDESTTTFRTQTQTVTNEDGSTTEVETTVLELKTVDGKTTVEEFIHNLSLTDGYAGSIDTTKKNAAGYYPVDVDEDGYGVWAYLCSYSEIQKNTEYDTNLGKAAAEGKQLEQLSARITISAQKSKTNIEPVSTAAALQEAVNANEDKVIRLESDIELSGALQVSQGQRVFLDLNGYTLSSTTAAGALINVKSGSALTVTSSVEGGTLSGNADSGYGITAIGAEVTLNSITLQNVKYGVYIMDHESESDLDSKVRIVNCELQTTGEAIFVLGNGTASSQTTQLVVENTTINSGHNAISGSGDIKYSGTDIQIINSTITGYYAALYQPQTDSTATVYNSVLSGNTTVAIKGGDVQIVDTRVTATGQKLDPVGATDGYSDTGDAIYIDTTNGYAVGLEISGKSIITSEKGYCIQLLDPQSKNVSIKLSGGSFDEEQPAEYLAENATQAKVTPADGSAEYYVITLKEAEQTQQEAAEDEAANG